MSKQQQLKAAAAWINSNAPALRDKIVADANLALEGRLVISGSKGQPVFAGNPPEWKAIKTGDSHYGSDLNRMWHWLPMLKAHLLTGNGRYAQKVVEELDSWIAACPRPPFPPSPERRFPDFYAVDGEHVPWHCLNSGIRMFESWRMMAETLVNTEFLPPERIARLSASMAEQAEPLFTISPVLFPHADHNHFLMETLGLLSVCELFPQLPEAQTWRAHAVKELDRCAGAQLAEDGAQIEACPSYHNGCISWFCLALRLANEAGLPMSDESTRRIRKMVDYALAATRPCGQELPWGDSHPGKGFVRSAMLAKSAFNDDEPLRLACQLAGQEEAKEICASFLWEASEPAALMDIVMQNQPPRSYPPRIMRQRQVKQVAMKTSWGREALGLFFACYSPVHYGNHGHADPCGFDFTALGKPLLVDPGCCAYYESEARRCVKIAAYHNMLTVNWREPFAYCSSFAYEPQREGDIDWTIDQPGLLAACAHHDNYAPALHRRVVALVDEAFLLVIDRLDNLFWLSSAQLYFQLNSQKVMAKAEERLVCTEDNDVNILLRTSPNLRLRVPPESLAKFRDEWDGQGLTRVRFDDDDDGTHQTSRAYAALAIPYKAGDAMPEHTQPVIMRDGDAWRVTFSARGKGYNFLWNADSLSSSR